MSHFKKYVLLSLLAGVCSASAFAEDPNGYGFNNPMVVVHNQLKYMSQALPLGDMNVGGVTSGPTTRDETHDSFIIGVNVYNTAGKIVASTGGLGQDADKTSTKSFTGLITEKDTVISRITFTISDEAKLLPEKDKTIPCVLKGSAFKSPIPNDAIVHVYLLGDGKCYAKVELFN
jgi:hypothetical protein